ncbi:hypothetical protein B0T20DRAFT_119124 [Sordaria brevicollis]|uniref:Uncharacterized protein n=1 Tax=Sordaria brevicollis TaxID=83679 RepID=A0AAE0PKM1_SORBR|nr:hypothetical protein B0T20DRAFT_119124 [Sordaria brevicollis]
MRVIGTGMRTCSSPFPLGVWLLHFLPSFPSLFIARSWLVNGSSWSMPLDGAVRLDGSVGRSVSNFFFVQLGTSSWFVVGVCVCIFAFTASTASRYLLTSLILLVSDQFNPGSYGEQAIGRIEKEQCGERREKEWEREIVSFSKNQESSEPHFSHQNLLLTREDKHRATIENLSR